MPSAVEQLIAPALVGAFLNTGLAGWSSQKTYTYLTHFQDDKASLKCMVVVLFTLDLAYTILGCWTPYDFLLFHYGDIVYAVMHWNPVAAGIVITTLITFIVQLFFAHKVFMLSKRSKVVPAIIAIASIISFGFGLSTAAMVVKIRNATEFTQYTYGIALWLCWAAFSDLAISSSMFWWLRTSDPTHVETQLIISRLIRQTFETNMLTAIVALLDALLYIGLPGEAWHLIPNAVLGKLYFISLLTSLNSRKEIADRIQRHRQKGGGGTTRGAQSGRTNALASVQIHIETLEGSDSEDAGMELTCTRRRAGLPHVSYEQKLDALGGATGSTTDLAPTTVVLPGADSEKYA